MRKINTIKSLCLAVAFVFTGFAANAQLTHLEQSMFLNFNAAMGAFNDDLDPVLASGDQIPLTRYNVGKNAGLGVGIGYRISYRFDVGFGEVSPYIHADFMWNRTKGDIRDKFLAADGTAPTYFNLPIFIGVNYRYQLNDIFTPFAEFGIGPDFFFITKESGTGTVVSTTTDSQTGLPVDSKISKDFKYKYRTTSNVAWQIGAGCFFGEHVSASLHYSGYGKHAIKTTDKDVSVQDDFLIDDKKNDTKVQNRSIGLLSLRIGFHF